MLVLNAILISIITAVILLLTILIVVLLIISKIKGSKTKTIPQKKAKTVLISELELNYDKKSELLEKKHSFLDFKNKLEAIYKDDKIERMVIDLDKFSLTYSKFEEVEDIFKRLREKKEVIAIGSVFTNESYLTGLLASKIYMVNTKNAFLMMQAYSKKMPYYKKLLEKIGIDVKIYHVGDFKSYGENYKLEEMSNNLKQNLTYLAEDKLKFFIEKVKEYRNVDIENDLIEGNIFLKNNYDALIDKKVNKYEFIEKDEKLINISEYEIKEKRKLKKVKNTIAVISLEGSISNNGLNFKKVYDKVVEAKKIDGLSGVILEINSPGGSAYESSLIYTMLRKEFKGIPIFASMKDVCASGGYFISQSAQKVFANKMTITGSIGVVSMYPNFKELTKKIGVNYSGIEKGETIEFGDFTKELSPKSEELLNEQIKGVYEEFKKVVIRSRIMSDERLEKIAGGRVFTGNMAFENGLVDEIGGLSETISAMKSYLKIDNAKIVQIEEKIKMKEQLKSKMAGFGLDTSLIGIPLMLYIEF